MIIAQRHPLRARADGQFKTSLVGSSAFAAAMAILAIVFGLVAATANPIVVGVASGALVGLLLLAKPNWNVSIVLVLGLFVVGVVPIWADGLATRAVWGVSILGFILLGSAVFTLVTNASNRRGTPGFIWIGLAFLVYCLITSILQWTSAGEFLGAFKRYFQAAGLMFALAWLSVSLRDITRWRGIMLIAGAAQLPFALYELIRLVPIREGLRSAVPGLVPIDVVAGTFGASLYTGGANAEMATFLIIVLLFLVARLRERLLSLRAVFGIGLIASTPLFLGETKAVVVFLPLAFFVLFRKDLWRRPHYALIGILLSGILTFGAGTAYLVISKKTLEEQVTDTLQYNFYNQGHGLYYLNRTRVLFFWAEKQSASDPIRAVFGHGMGASHEATQGHIAARYPRYGVGMTAAATLLWDVGIVGLSLFIAMLMAAWRTAEHLQSAENPPWIRADANAIQSSLPLFAIYIFYRLALLESLSFQIVFAALMGYLAWLYRKTRAIECPL